MIALSIDHLDNYNTEIQIFKWGSWLWKYESPFVESEEILYSLCQQKICAIEYCRNTSSHVKVITQWLCAIEHCRNNASQAKLITYFYTLLNSTNIIPVD